MFKRIIATIALIAAAVCGCAAQTFPQITTQQVTFTGTTTPVPVSQITANVVGQPGGQSYYIWVVAEFAVGNATPSAGLLVRNAPVALTSANYLNVSWFPVSGATSYDVLLTTTDVTPSGACNCAAVVANAGTQYQIKTNTLQSYTVNTWSGSTAYTVTNPAAGLTFAGGSGIPLVLHPNGNADIYNTWANNGTIAGGYLGSSAEPIADILTLGPVLDVRAEGAKCDGATNDSTAVETAIVAGAAISEPVLIPKGLICLAANILLASNLHLIVQGTLKLPNGTAVNDGDPGNILTGAVNGPNGVSVLTAAENSGRTISTYTTATSPGNVASVRIPGALVTITGVTDSTFNGTFTVATVISNTSFTVANTAPASNATSSGGSAVIKATSAANTLYLTSNIEIDGGGTLDGNYQNNPETQNGSTINSSFAGSDINLVNSYNVHIHNLSLINARLDGVSVGWEQTAGTDFSKFDHLTFSGNQRNDIDTTAGRMNLYDALTDNSFNGTGPCFDIEADLDSVVNSDSTISNYFCRTVAQQDGVDIVSQRTPVESGWVITHNHFDQPNGGSGVVIYTDIAGGSSILANTILGGLTACAYGPPQTGNCTGVVTQQGQTGSVIDGISPVLIQSNTISGFKAAVGWGGNPSGFGSTGRFTFANNNVSNVGYGLDLMRSGDVWSHDNTYNAVGGTSGTSLVYTLFGQGATYLNQGRIRVDHEKFEDNSVTLSNLFSVNLGSGDANDLPGALLTATSNEISNSLTGTSASVVFTEDARVALYSNEFHCLAGSACTTFGSDNGVVWKSLLHAGNLWDTFDTTNGFDFYPSTAVGSTVFTAGECVIKDVTIPTAFPIGAAVTAFPASPAAFLSNDLYLGGAAINSAGNVEVGVCSGIAQIIDPGIINVAVVPK